MEERDQRGEGPHAGGAGTVTSGALDAGRDSLDDEMEQRMYGDEAMEQMFEEARKESMRIMENRFTERERVKQSMESTRRRAGVEKQFHRRQQESFWRQRMKRSPFIVDLVAEDERVNEENTLRRRRERREQHRRSERRERVKNDIILKALSEASDLEALREEKRAILLQEKRLKALLDLEKAKLKRKEDMLAAQRAERKRRDAFLKHRRREREREEREKQEERVAMLQDKHQLPPVPTGPDGQRKVFQMRVGRGVTGALGGRCG